MGLNDAKALKEFMGLVEGRSRSLPVQDTDPAQEGMRAFLQSARGDLIVSQAIANSFVSSWDSGAQFAVKVAVWPALQAAQSACGERLSSVIVLKEGQELIITSDDKALHTVQTPEALKMLLGSSQKAAKGVRAILEDSIALTQHKTEKTSRKQVGVAAGLQRGAQRSTKSSLRAWHSHRSYWS